jgi:hypothetical protein
MGKPKQGKPPREAKLKTCRYCGFEGSAFQLKRHVCKGDREVLEHWKGLTNAPV